MITEEALQFLADLIANNNTEWMHANKKRYENFKKEELVCGKCAAVAVGGGIKECPKHG